MTTTTTRRAYYVRYHRFANQYSLRYTVGGAELSIDDGWERITRRWEPSRSGYADAYIYPAD